ncbi:MAG TPA: site-specific integrase, partial [Bdellovibrionota bacterium]|nr:site-specific integrase [Bdellovibrionota bacterium]
MRKKPRLGELLLKRLGKARTRPVPKKARRKAGASFFHVAEAAPALPAVVPGAPALPHPKNPESRALATTELTRPGDKLRTSIEAFLLDQRSPHTRRSYGKDLKRFVQYLHGRVAGFGAEAIDRSVIVSYKEFLLAEGLEHTTVDRHLSTLRSFFRWLVDDGVLAKNPAEG